MVQIHMPQGSNGKAQFLSYLVIGGFVLLEMAVIAYVIVLAIKAAS